jgi:hypothetical protein
MMNQGSTDRFSSSEPDQFDFDGVSWMIPLAVILAVVALLALGTWRG